MFPLPKEKVHFMAEVQNTIYLISTSTEDEDAFKSIYYLRTLRGSSGKSCFPGLEISPRKGLELPESCPYYRNFDEAGGNLKDNAGSLDMQQMHPSLMYELSFFP